MRRTTKTWRAFRSFNCSIFSQTVPIRCKRLETSTNLELLLALAQAIDVMDEAGSKARTKTRENIVEKKRTKQPREPRGANQIECNRVNWILVSQIRQVVPFRPGATTTLWSGRGLRPLVFFHALIRYAKKKIPSCHPSWRLRYENLMFLNRNLRKYSMHDMFWDSPKNEIPDDTLTCPSTTSLLFSWHRNFTMLQNDGVQERDLMRCKQRL